MNFVDDIKSFLKVPFNRYLAIALILLGLFLIFSEGKETTNNSEKFRIDFFFLPTCPHCAEQKPFNEKLMQEFPNITFVYHDVSDPKELDLLIKKAQEYGISYSEIGVPATFFGNQSFIGYSEEIGKKIRSALVGCLQVCAAPTNESITASKEQRFEINLPLFGNVNVKKMSLPVLSVVLGLVDGFNPCAMWVLVYLIALVMELGDRKKIWFIVGSFVFASGVLYFLFMTAWLNAFLILGYIRIINILVGLVAVGGGILSIKEYIETKGQLECKVVGVEEKKKTMKKAQDIVSAPLTIATMIAIVALAFVVNSVEFVSSGNISSVDNP